MDDAAVEVLKISKIRLENKLDQLKEYLERSQDYTNSLLADIRKCQGELSCVEMSIIKLESFK